MPKGDEGHRRGQGDPSKTNHDPKGLALPSHTAALHPIRALKGKAAMVAATYQYLHNTRGRHWSKGFMYIRLITQPPYV